MKRIGWGGLALSFMALACIVVLVSVLALKEMTPAVAALAALLGAASVTLLAVAFFMRADIRDATAITLVSVVLTLYAAELYFALGNKPEAEFSYPDSHDRRTMREVLADLQGKGDKTAVPIVYPSYLLTRPDLFVGNPLIVDGKATLPLSGISSRTTVLCNESGYWATYTSDEFGFHNPKGLWHGKVDIAVIGDSFSHGNCVHSGEDWVSRLRKHHPRTLNLGMGGNGPLYELATLKEYLVQAKPRVVLWEYYEANDSRIFAEETTPILMRYLVEPSFRQGLMQMQPKLDALLESLVAGLAQNHATPSQPRLKPSEMVRLVNLRNSLGLQFGKPRSPLPVLTRALAEGDKVVKGWGGQLYLVYLPSMHGLSGKAAPHYASREQILDIARQLKIPVIDLYEPLARHPDPKSLFPYRRPLHYNAAGYEIVAGQVQSRLAKDGFSD